MKLPEITNIPDDLRVLAHLTPTALAGLDQMNEEQALRFRDMALHEVMDSGQIAAIALSQTRYVISDHLAASSINRFLRFEEQVTEDVLWADSDTRHGLLSKVLCGRPNNLPQWPENLFDATMFSPKQLAEMPCMTNEQVSEFNHGNMHLILTLQQKAALALSQPHELMPKEVALHAMGAFLGVHDREDASTLLETDQSLRHALLTKVLLSTRPDGGSGPRERAGKHLTSMLGSHNAGRSSASRMLAP